MIKQNLTSKIEAIIFPFQPGFLMRCCFVPGRTQHCKPSRPQHWHNISCIQDRTGRHKRIQKQEILVSYLQIPQDWMIFNAREKHPHGVGSVIEERDPGSIQIARQLVNICLKLCKGWHKKGTTHVAMTVHINRSMMGKALRLTGMRLRHKWRSNMWRGRRWWTRAISPFL